MATEERGSAGAVSLSVHDINDLVSRICAAVDPDQIILFGSAAAGGMTEDSDVDVLIVKSGSFHPRRVASDAYLRLAGFPYALDLPVVTPEDLRDHAGNPALVYRSALRDGRVIYDRTGNSGA